MDFFLCYIFYITRFPDGQCREKERGVGGGENWSSFTSESREGTEEEAQCHESFTGRSTLLADQSPSDWKKRRRREGERRSESTEELSLCGQWVLLLLQTVHLLALLPLSLPGLIGRSVGM